MTTSRHICARLLLGLCLTPIFPIWAQEESTPAPESTTEANTEATTAIKPAAVDRPSHQLVRARLQQQARQLLADTEAPPTAINIPVNGTEVLGFWNPDASGKPVGAILMLHDHAQSPRHPATLLNLHRVMPKFGWATLSIQLPSLPPESIPARVSPPLSNPLNDKQEAANDSTASTDGTKVDESKVDETQVVHEEPDTAAEPAVAVSAPTTPEPTVEEIEQETMATIQAALDYLQQQDQYNIVIMGNGLGASRALTFVSQAQMSAPPPSDAQPKSGGIQKRAVMERPIRALVLLDADFSERGTKPIADLLSYPEIPTLDLLTSTSLEARSQADERKQISLKMQYKIYSVRRLTPQAGDLKGDQENPMTKTIRGFVTRHAQGVEL